jgi:hypothetical protein
MWGGVSYSPVAEGDEEDYRAMRRNIALAACGSLLKTVLLTCQPVASIMPVGADRRAPTFASLATGCD